MLRRRAKIVAWTLSVGFHVALAVVLLRDDVGRVRTLPATVENATREDGAAESAFTLAVERTIENAPPAAMAIAPPTGQRPVEALRPEPIVPELKKLISQLASRPSARVEVQDVTPIEFRNPVVDPKPVGTATEPMPMTAKAGFGKTQPLHAALPAGKSVVYILDRSTSMGLTRENFDAARAATLASVAALPDDARFQVIAYNRQATRLLGHELQKKSEKHEATLTEALLCLKPEGDSHHDRALRSALLLGADVLVFITDAGEDELAVLRPIIKGHDKPVSVVIVRVADGKVGAPTAFR